MSRFAPRRERAQVVAVAIVALLGLMGFAALTTDLGVAWYAKRQLQASVDAAALAGAQDLPDTTTAAASATRYAALQPPRNATVDTPVVTTKCTAAAAACDPANAVVVRQTAHVSTTFLRLFGMPRLDISASATACQPCGTAPFDVMVAMDRSGSMCDTSSNCLDLNNAKDGVRTLLQLMEPDLDRIGLAAFPPLPPASSGFDACDSPLPMQGPYTDSHGNLRGDNASYYDHPSAWYVLDALGNDYKTSVGAINSSSAIVRHLATGGSGACIPAGGNTSYADALSQAWQQLQANGRPGIPKIIIFMTDGEANIGPVWDCNKAAGGTAYGYTLHIPYPSPCTSKPASAADNMQPCHTAINVANAIKAADVTIYTIGYGLRDGADGTAKANCQRGGMDSSGVHVAGVADESPTITSYDTLLSIASTPKDGSSKAGTTFHNRAQPGDLSRIFTAIAADITKGTSRLVDSTY